MAKRIAALKDETTFDAVQVTQHNKTFYLLKLPASVLTKISYVAVRGRSEEQGAVQRILNRSRISSIKDYTLKGGAYPSSVVLNWVNQKHEVRYIDGQLRIPSEERSSQIIDGQHRIAGISAAIEQDPLLGALEIPVTMYVNLGTEECANIFLAINTEQKPVSKSLVYDLYGVASGFLVDYAVSRARDIALALNDIEESAYFQLVRQPTEKSKSGISLATIVSALKPLVDEKGTFEQVGVKTLEQQTQIIINFFGVLREKYGPHWDSPKNAFMYAAGFIGGVEFLRRKLFDYCYRERSFERETMSRVIVLGEGELIEQSDIKGLGGAKSRELVAERLIQAFLPEADSDSRLRF